MAAKKIEQHEIVLKVRQRRDILVDVYPVAIVFGTVDIALEICKFLQKSVSKRLGNSGVWIYKYEVIN